MKRTWKCVGILIGVTSVVVLMIAGAKHSFDHMFDGLEIHVNDTFGNENAV